MNNPSLTRLFTGWIAPFALAAIIFPLASQVIAADETAEPQWHQPEWQAPLVAWLKVEVMAGTARTALSFRPPVEASEF